MHCQCSVDTVTDVCRGNLKKLAIRVFDIRSLTWDEWGYSQLLLLDVGLSDPRITEQLLTKKKILWTTGHAWGKSSRYAENHL